SAPWARAAARLPAVARSGYKWRSGCSAGLPRSSSPTVTVTNCGPRDGGGPGPSCGRIDNYMTGTVDERTRLVLCYDSLHGLPVGDALAAQFFVPGRSIVDLAAGRPPAGVWEWTDDSEMACSVVAELRDHRHIDQDRLAGTFAHRCEPYRGYG